MNIEDKANEVLAEFKTRMMAIAEETIGGCYGDVLPHVENDTYMNVEYRSDAVIRKMLAGEFTKDEDGKSVCVKDDNGISCRIRITSNMYDNMRDNFIKNMPQCPKDLKIKALEKEIARLHVTNYF